MKQGVEDGSGVYHDFAESVREAEAQAEVRALEYWRSAMLTDWRAAAGFLSRRHPERWGDKATEAAGMLNRDNWTDPVYDPEAIELGVTYLAALEALKKRNPVVELDARIDGLLERRDRDREPD
jgi:hypothetical protein